MKWNNSAGDEIFAAMQQIEIAKFASEQTSEDQAIVSALEELSEAAKSFEQAGLDKQAQEVTSLMVSIAKKTDKKPEKKKAPTKEEEESFKFFGFKKKDLEKDNNDAKKPKKDAKKPVAKKKAEVNRFSQFLK